MRYKLISTEDLYFCLNDATTGSDHAYLGMEDTHEFFDNIIDCLEKIDDQPNVIGFTITQCTILRNALKIVLDMGDIDETEKKHLQKLYNTMCNMIDEYKNSLEST